MKNFKQAKGITLVALIITIIVLLILAVVTIATVTGDGILGHARNSKDKYQEGQATEENMVGDYVSYLDNKVGLVGFSGTGSSDSTGGSNSSGENTSEGKLGKYVRYDVNKNGVIENDQYESILWRVLRDDETRVELITAEALGNVTFRQGTFDEARNNYNRAVELMVQECIRVTGIPSVRNVGGPAAEESLSATNTIDFSELKEFSPTVADREFAKYEGATNGLRKGNGNNYLTDFNQMKKAGVVKASWLATRWVSEYSGTVYFSIPFIGSEGDGTFVLWYRGLGEVYANGNTHFDGKSMPNSVRPVLTLASGILDNAAGAGTESQPIEIY